MNDPELSRLAHTWQCAHPDPLPTSPARLSRAARAEARVGVGTVAFLTGFTAWAGQQAARGDSTWGLLAIFAAALALAVGGGLLRMRRTARAADTLLLGSPVDVARGHRQHLYLRLCALRSTSAVVVSVSPIPLYLGLAAAGMVPWLVAGVSAVGWAGCLAWLHLRTAPRLQAEVARLDGLITELAE